MPIRAVLFDFGGPIDTEEVYEQLIDRDILDAARAEGIPVTDDGFRAANDWAIEVFAPSTYRAIVWRLTGGDAELAERVYASVRAGAPERHRLRGGIELRAGIDELVARLHTLGLIEGLVTNQASEIIAELEEVGIGKYFARGETPARPRYHKPDVRAFTAVTSELAVLPAECIMVGDRIDNDIVPAKLLGMRTVRFRTGRHVNQQPRMADEAPDVEVSTVDELEAAIRRLAEL